MSITSGLPVMQAESRDRLLKLFFLLLPMSQKSRPRANRRRHFTPRRVHSTAGKRIKQTREDCRIPSQSIRLGNPYGLEPDSSQGRWVKIVGVVADAHRLRALELPMRQEIFFPVAQRLELSRAVTLLPRGIR